MVPPPWASFLRSNSNGAAGAGSSSSPSNAGINATPTRVPYSGASRDKPLPRVPDEAAMDHPPTLIGRDGERHVFPTPPRPRPRTADRQHQHNRSASHPLPKIFGRKKSAGNLGGHTDADVALDEGLVPVLDEHQLPSSTPTRVISGKKNARVDDDDAGKTQRKCMCCASKVKVPRELDKFRCMACLCINDLRPVDLRSLRQQQQQQLNHLHPSSGPVEDELDGVSKGKKPQILSDSLSSGPRIVPLSLDRTRAIIDQCIVAYLEARCRPDGEHTTSSRRYDVPLQTPEEKDNPHDALPARHRSPRRTAQQLSDDVLSSSPPEPIATQNTPSSHSVGVRFAPKLDNLPSVQNGTSRTVNGPGTHSSVQRSAIPRVPDRKPPPRPVDIGLRMPSQKLSPNGPLFPGGELSPRPPPSPRLTQQEVEARIRYERVKTIFRPLEDYIAEVYGDFRALNTSFSTIRPTHMARARSESNIVTPPPQPCPEYTASPVGLSQLDAKMLLLGDIGENSTWWTGRLNRNDSENAALKRKKMEGARRTVSSKSPNINWSDLKQWYELVHSAGADWQSKINQITTDDRDQIISRLEGASNAAEIEDELAQAQDHTVRALLKVTENILKRPGQQLKEPDDLRWLLIILMNPSLYPAKARRRRATSGTASQPTRTGSRKQTYLQPPSPVNTSPKKSLSRGETQQHSGLLKRTFGLLAGTNDTCHRYLVGWISRFDEQHFIDTVDLVASFVTNRISRRSTRSHERSAAADGGLIPDLSGSAMNTSAQLRSAMGLSGSVKKLADDPDQEPEYANDWQIKAAAKVMSLLFAANNIWQGQRADNDNRATVETGITPQDKARRSGQLLHTSNFYNTLLDYGDILADFKTWELKRDKFAFCQYPFFLSMGSKIKILEYDARRQMEIKAREAYFDSVIRHRAWDGYFHLRVRRDCMVDDSLRQISEAVGSGPEELKKGLRVHFTGEEGVDAGGPRKEWFLLLVRDIFDPNHGLFVYDDESHTCYFNPNSFETSDQYYLVGALLGLAIYNSTILDIALPPFAFRKLLAAAPAPAPGTGSANNNVAALTSVKGQMTYTLADLAEFHPSLAVGLRQLLEFPGDVQETYCWNFVAPVERYGTVVEVPLVPNGENTPVTNGNRQEFVDAYVRYLLDTSVSRQFDPFKRGFFQVCAGNALSLFRAEEIELLVRGSDEALDVDSLRAVAVYENWKAPIPPYATLSGAAAVCASIPVVRWFWDIFAAAEPDRQRGLLSFITGTDRIPAVGATSLILRIVAGADGSVPPTAEERARFPVARTCFNMVVLWRYESREQLEQRLWRAVDESEGFGLK